MSASLNEKKIHISSPLLSSEKQGIVTILRSDQVNSLRRTMSADMSSKKWLAQHGHSPAMKKVASSEEFSVSIRGSSSSSDGEGDSDDWCSIREENLRTETERQPVPIDIWSSILSDKAREEASKSLLPPYIHPLVKRSASSLSEKSLEICTESLGSETGSDGFSSYSPSETGEDGKDEEESEKEKAPTFFSQTVKMEEVIRPVIFNQKKSPSRSFPPPLPWLSGSAGASVRVQSRRENGRLTVEAVYSPSHSNFLAYRQDSRLVLSFADYEQLEADLEENDPEKEDEEYSDTVEEEDEEEEEREAEKDDDHLQANFPQLKIIIKNGVINVPRLALMVKRSSGIAKNRDNEETKSEAEGELFLKPRLSPPLTTAIEAPCSINAYEYYWRSKALALTKPIRQENPSSSTTKNSSTKLIFSKKSMETEQKKQEDDFFASFSKKCKEPRKSLLFWEPYHCIATSS